MEQQTEHQNIQIAKQKSRELAERLLKSRQKLNSESRMTETKPLMPKLNTQSVEVVNYGSVNDPD